MPRTLALSLSAATFMPNKSYNSKFFLKNFKEVNT